jgi:putative hydrolase of the HAD superfamily
LISASVSSSDHGFMKPHPEIFRAALDLMRVPAAEAAMVGDSLAHDVAGARGVGMRGILLARGDVPEGMDPDIEVVRSLDELVRIV